MNTTTRWLLSLCAATLVPTLLPTLYFCVVFLTSPYPDGTAIFLVFIVALMITLGHLGFLGIPGLLVLSRTRQFKAWTICVLGFFLGCLPMSIWSWPLRASLRGASESHWDGEKMMSSMVNGVPTFAGWLSYGKGVLAVGLLGAASGTAFWLAWKYAGLQNQHKTPSSLPLA
jgi:hypothetical protein